MTPKEPAPPELLQHQAAHEGQERKLTVATRPALVAKRVDQHELRDQLWVTRCQRQRDRTTQGVPHDGGGAELQAGVQIGNRFGEGLDAIREATRRRLLARAEARQIGRDHAKRFGQLGHHQIPARVIDEQAVNQDHRRA